MCQRIFNHFYVIGPKATEFGEITQTTLPLRHSRSFKVADFGTYRKLICDFLLVINTYLPPILHRFQVMSDFDNQVMAFKFSLATGGRFTLFSYLCTLTTSLGVFPCECGHKLYIAEN